jgi:hypothetical protein
MDQCLAQGHIGIFFPLSAWVFELVTFSYWLNALTARLPMSHQPPVACKDTVTNTKMTLISQTLSLGLVYSGKTFWELCGTHSFGIYIS